MEPLHELLQIVLPKFKQLLKHHDNYNDNHFGYLRTVSALLVYKGPSIHKKTNLAKWRCVKIEIQMFIASRNPNQGKATVEVN